MNITFLVGNGFDIDAGVDTSYRGFYDWYCIQPSSKPHIEKFKKKIAEEIQSGSKYWSDFEVGLGRYTEEFTVETIGEFLDCYDDAQKSIVKYLSAQCEGYDYKPDKNSIEQARKAISKYYIGTSPAEQRTFQQLIAADRAYHSEIRFVSFNYTDILDKYIKMLFSDYLQTWKYSGSDRFLKINPSVIHANGFVKLYPVIGVNDESQVANQELLCSDLFTSVLLKSKSIVSVGQLWHEQAETTISQSQIVCIFGMSLGATDAKWWRKLAEWLRANNNRHLIIFWHSKLVSDMVSIRNKILAESNVVDTFLSYSNINESVKSSLRNRVHVCINNKDLFPIKLKSIEMENNSSISLQSEEVALSLQR